MAASKCDWFYQSAFWSPCVLRMYANLEINDNNRKIGLGKKEMLEVKKSFVCKTPSLKEFRIKNYMPKICENFQKVEAAT